MPNRGLRESAGLRVPEDTICLGREVRVQNSCRGLREPAAVASVNFKEGLSPQGTWRWGLEALGDMAPGDATGLCATHQNHLTEELTEERMLREAP